MDELGINEMDAAAGELRALEVRAMDLRVASALERRPVVRIPADFAARVAAQLPVRRGVAVMPARHTPARYGLIAMWGCVAALVVAIVALGLNAASHTVVGVTLEWVLCAQLIGLALWLGGVRNLIAPEA